MTYNGAVAELVGGLVLSSDGKLLIQRRSMQRKAFPGAWDIIGGSVEPDEDLETALAREVAEETGWRLRSILGWCFDEAVELNGASARERVAVITVEDTDSGPRLEPGKATEFAWVSSTDRLADQNVVDGWGSHIPDVLRAGFEFLRRRDDCAD